MQEIDPVRDGWAECKDRARAAGWRAAPDRGSHHGELVREGRDGVLKRRRDEVPKAGGPRRGAVRPWILGHGPRRARHDAVPSGPCAAIGWLDRPDNPEKETVFLVERSAPAVWRSARAVERSLPAVWRSARAVERSIPAVWRSVPDVWRSAPDVWRSAPDAQRSVPDVQQSLSSPARSARPSGRPPSPDPPRPTPASSHKKGRHGEVPRGGH